MSRESPNVVLLCLDSLRKDYYDDNAPRLRELASVRFEEMRAMSSWSVPSHASMFTGRLPRETGVHAHNRDMTDIEGETWLSELAGYHTLGVSANVYASPVFGFDELFDEFVSISRSRRFPDGLDVQEHIMNREEAGLGAYLSFLRTAATHDHPVESVLNGLVLKADDVMQDAPFRKPFDFGAKAIVRELEDRLVGSDEPVFAFANLMDTHTPHTPFRGIPTDAYSCPADFTTDDYETWDVNLATGIEGFETEVGWFRELYAATVSYVDRVVADFIERVQAAADRETVFVVTADHGENLGYEDDGYLMHHSSSLSEGLLHVPFDVVGPVASDGSVETLSSHRDLGAIVAALADRAPVDGFTTDRAEAEVLGPSSEDYPEDEREYWCRAMHAVYADDRKYVRDELGTEECWDVSGAPCRQTLTDEPVPDDVFGLSFEEWVDAVEASRGRGADREVSDAVEERLRQFGYL
jgi:arylsulfatase A-like enzyme